jgi:hypothetical protein
MLERSWSFLLKLKGIISRNFIGMSDHRLEGRIHIHCERESYKILQLDKFTKNGTVTIGFRFVDSENGVSTKFIYGGDVFRFIDYIDLTANVYDLPLDLGRLCLDQNNERRLRGDLKSRRFFLNFNYPKRYKIDERVFYGDFNFKKMIITKYIQDDCTKICIGFPYSDNFF